MHFRLWRRQVLACALTFACTTVIAADLGHPDHYEFDAVLSVPFRAVGANFPIKLDFDYPGAGGATQAAWILDVLAPDGKLIGSDTGIAPLDNGRGTVTGRWNSRSLDGKVLAPGYYTVRLRAVPTIALREGDRMSVEQRVQQALAMFADEVVEQRYDVMLGQVPKARMPAMQLLKTGHSSGAAIGAGAVPQGAATLKAAATASLPYTIYYGNLHSQTNHSDGGTAVASCAGSEVPQGGSMGPSDAYAMMKVQAGGDFLLTSEHNHMYDGSTGTNLSASPVTANNLFASGLSAAASYRSANPDFMALYGTEWGVISNGGHLNIINPDALASWEYNSSNQLIGSVATVKSDYANLYATMRTRGWIGQFNHPSTTQFAIGGIGMAYDANGADVMVLAEVLNSSAFSTNVTQTEAGRSSYVAAWNKLLEAGYRVAPTTNQDNHCANWGLSFTNRTGVLLPSDAALTTANFYDALRARRVFASEDRTSQLVLTGNGNVMGMSFANSGSLTLAANFASASGQTAQRVQFFEGVPGRNGTVTQLTEGSGSYTFTPATGKHFYYAQVTQANGLRLWSAPIWVDQGGTPPVDTTPPTVSASVTGSSGTINLSTITSDNVGVTRVEFYIDGALVGAVTNPPFAMTYDSTTLANGSHSLTAKAFDAAGNNTTSTAVAFNISNVTADTTAPTVSSSVSGTSGTITLSATASDNVGVTKVEFLVDGVLKGSDTTAPYAMTLDSTTLANGSHTLTAKAYDAANNVGTSTAVAFSVDNSAPAVERLLNGSFESGKTSWAASSGVITNSSTYAARTGTWKAWLNGYGKANTEYVYQSVAIPATATSATLTFWLRVASNETTTTAAYDTLKIQVRNGSNAVLATLATYSNLNKGSSYVQRTFDVSAYKGQTIRVYFEGVEGAQVATSFIVDDVSLMTK
ncbi:MAG: CehA/McbA family metallohydrolase [Xanthomonadaceae bacterium]|nr:CehA/McbA family metallohydrolase [Xanthomonadaceae bacterium]